MKDRYAIIEITGPSGDVVEAGWLARAEAVHRQLRPQLPPGYEAKMRKVFAEGGRMCVAADGTEVAGLAVFRLFENTHVGRRFYVDDLVTDERQRGGGVGSLLIAWLEALARRLGCSGLELESGTHRTRAHRFYFREGFTIPSFSFRKEFR